MSFFNRPQTPPSPGTTSFRSLLKVHEEDGNLAGCLAALHASAHQLGDSEVSWRIHNTGNRALILAAENNDINRICEVISQWRAEKGAQWSGSSIKEDALVVAVRRRHRDVAELLVRSGAVVGGGVVHAVQEEFANGKAEVGALEDVLEGLVAGGWDVNSEVKGGGFSRKYALLFAAREASGEECPFLDWLLAHGASPLVSQRVGSMFSHGVTTVFSWHDGLTTLTCMRKLFAHGAQPDSNVLHRAIRNLKDHPDRIDIIKLQLDHGADVNALETGIIWTSNGAFPIITYATPLFEAVSQRDLAVMKLLLERGADARARNEMRYSSQSGPGLNALEKMRVSEDADIRTMADERWGRETRAQRREKARILMAVGPQRCPARKIRKH